NAPPVPPARLRPGQVRRTIAIVIDDLLMSAEDIPYTRAALRKYVDEQLQPGDLVSIVRTSAGAGFFQQFTDDRAALYRAIERVHWQPRTSVGQSAVGTFNPLNGMEETQETGTVGTADTLPGAVNNSRSGLKDAEDYRREVHTVGTLGMLNFVVRGLREMPGRKAVILFSDGMAMRDKRGEGVRYAAILDRLIDLANRASVVFYTIDARGLQPLSASAADDTGGSPAAPGPGGGSITGVSAVGPDRIGQQILGPRADQMYEGQAGLYYLASSTGGLTLFNQNDLNKGVRRALDDMSGYYLIGFRPDDAAFDQKTGRPRFNSLRLRVRGRPGLRVRTRSGYFGTPEAESSPQPQTRAQQLMAALISPFGAADVNLRLTSLFMDVPGAGPAVRSLLLIDPHTLTFKQEAGQYQTTLDILAVTFGEDGRVVDHINRVETIRVPPDSFRRFEQEGMVYDLNVPVQKPGAYQLRIAVRDTATERTGSASQYVEVPDLGRKRLTLSGLVVAAPSAEEVQAGPAARRFRRGALLDYGLVIYNARADKATGRPRLTIQARLFRDGKEVYAGQPQPFDPQQQSGLERIEAAGRLQIGNEMAPGEYVLQVIVTDELADKDHAVAAQWIDFEVIG
ncbi:MAG TPA: VWA domain-containing protein, partial [Pyrinomonadaceae bacterium]|nr:VWA domain-containing protein [Pyrinomonadaceae bacterium]